MTSNNLSQIADVLERIESHLLTIASLLAARQGLAVRVLPGGQSFIGNVRPGDTQAVSR